MLLKYKKYQVELNISVDKSPKGTIKIQPERSLSNQNFKKSPEQEL